MHKYEAVQERTDLVAISSLITVPESRPNNGNASHGSDMVSRIETNGSNLAKLWELRGRRVIETNNVYWGEYKGGFYTSLPFQLHLDPERDEIREILRKTSARGLRFPSANQPGLRAGMYVCRPSTHSLQSVSRKQKGHVTRGLEVFEFRKVDPDELREQGMTLNRDTLLRQDRHDATFLDEKRFRQFVDVIERCPGTVIYGVFQGDRLAAYIIGIRDGEWLHLMYKMSRQEDLANSPNHALDFSIIRDAAATPGIQFIGNGFSSLVEHEGLDRYKRQMGYELKEHNLCLHLHPRVAPLLGNAVAVAAARGVSRLFPKNETLTYAVTVLDGVRASRPAPAEKESPSEDMCQQEDASFFSRLRRPAFAFPALRMLQTVKKGGPGYMVRRGMDYVRRRSRGSGGPKPAVKRPFDPDEVLNLQPGDLVQVKSLEEIRATLDARGKNRGLLFTDDMRGFAGKQFRVFKRVESIFLEESKQRRTLKNTVMLDAAYCPGITFRCDRSCFLFWKEVWLRRLDAPEAASQQGNQTPATE